MARMYSRKKGKSGSKRPVSKRIPQWCTYTPEEVEDLIIKLAKKDITPSKIGVIIRDQYSIPLVKPILGKKITEVLSTTEHKLSVPEDLTSLLKKAESLKKHLDKNKSDYYNKRALTLIESKIHNLSKYYKKKGLLSPQWKYKTAVAAVV